MSQDSEYDRLAQWSEHRGVSNYTLAGEWTPVWIGLGLTAALGLGMYWVVRATAWVVARRWL